MALPQATLPSLPQATLPSLPQATLPSLPQATLPSLPQATLPSLPQATLPSLPQATSLPFDIRLEIAKISPAAYYALTTADPELGRYSLKPHIQRQMKARFTTIAKTITESNIICTKYTLPNGNLHRDNDEPAIIMMLDDSCSIDDDSWYRYKSTAWYINGEKHRDGDKPAHILYADEHFVEQWYKNNQLHRDNGKPARIEKYNGNLFQEDFYTNGQLFIPARVRLK